MIVRSRPSLLALFFILRGSIVRRIFPQILVTFGLSALVVALHQERPALLPGFSGAPFALIGIALSVFLGFRNSACYDRWWEARRQWGQLVFLARNLARQSLVLEPGQAAARRRLLGLAIGFAHALKRHLRPGAEAGRVRAHLTEAEFAAYEASRNPPDLLLRLLGAALADLRAAGALGDIPFQMLDRTLCDMAGVQASCERIRATPVPFAYTLLLHRTAYLFCFLLPFFLLGTLGWFTPFAAALVAYTFFGLDALGDELEEPFGTQPNCLPIAALAETIEINLREALGETGLPPLPAPRDHLLL